MTDEVAEKKPRAAAAKKVADEKTKAVDLPPEMNIYQRINAISQEAGALAPEAKGGVPFAFRGIDGTVAHLTPFLHKYGVFLSPVVQSHIVVPNAVGNRTVKTTELEVKYKVYGPDGPSDIEIIVPGLADDFADRSSAQAMSVAYRIALLQLFHLPTHSKEPEETGQEVQNAAASSAVSAPRGPKAVEAARAKTETAETGVANVAKLQAEAKALGRELNKGPDDLNALGSEISGGAGPDVWFSNPEMMTKLVAALKAEKKAAE